MGSTFASQTASFPNADGRAQKGDAKFVIQSQKITKQKTEQNKTNGALRCSKTKC